jgi:phosphodiesterase/alkaline phosphatase D-like protein
LTLVLAFTVWVAALGWAQQDKNVQITNGPVVENVTGTTAQVAWSTNVNASTVLKYGTDRNNLTQTAETPWGGLTHRATLNNLQPNTTYYFEVQSAQGQGTGTGALSQISEFKTSGNQSASAQQGQTPSTVDVVAGPIPQQVTDTSAKLWWETSQPVTCSTVKYGTSPSAMNQQAQSSSSDQLSHTAQLAGLQPDTQYYISVVRQDGKESAKGNFRTKQANFASSGKVNLTNGPVIEYLANNQAVISWSTSAPSSSVVKYGTDPNALNQTAQGPWTSGTHRVTLNNLQANTRYWFQVQSGQAQGTGTIAESGAYPFKTIAPGQSALNITKQ